MISGSTPMLYNIYTSAPPSTVWGDGSGTTQTVNNGYLLGLSGATTNFTAYGSINANQTLAVGAYADSIIVTITY
jgi:spore coat protein U-like protein